MNYSETDSLFLFSFPLPWGGEFSDLPPTFLGVNMSDEVHTKDVPYIVHEMAMARMERQSKRLFIVCLVLIGLLFGTNGAWIFYESQYETTSVTQEVDTGEGSATVIGVGNYGESETDSQDEK